MTTSGMTAMRVAATLAHVLPFLRVRLRRGDETLLEVGQPVEDGAVIEPCAFRRAVARAHQQVKEGVQLAFLGLPAGDEPAIDIGVRACDASLPGGVYRVTVGDRTVHGFVTTLPPRACRDVLNGVPDAGPLVRLHHDVATEVTFVHTVMPAADAPRDAAHLTAALEALLAGEVLRELALIT